ncbi:MAG TPA: peptide ABC transporter substrate-binding protein [Candidatus Dormibacteraeota bacterium]|jgi:peptide/nickel transport system substrate-binding protein|nr:peptide ABC transporter substrate-binding protein [Candidatus Dormibacteraeota bacterium]
MASVLLAACGGTNPGNTTSASINSSYSPAKGTTGGQLVYSDWEPVQDLNVLTSSAQTTLQVAVGPIWSALWGFDAQNKPIPDLVTDVPTTDNGMVKKIDDKHMDVTIKLKSGLKWSDGSALTANDVKFTVDAICNPDVGASSQLGFDHIASQEVKDSTTLIWHFGPNKSGTCGLSSDLTSGIYSPYLILGLSVTVVPQAALSNLAPKNWATSDYFTKKPTPTSGPYMVQDFTPGPSAIVTLVPNPNYAAGRSGAKFFGHAPYLQKLTYKIYGDKSSQIAGIKSGDTDLGLDLIAKDLPSIQSGWNGKAVYANGLLNEGIYMNLSNNESACKAQQYAETCGTPTVFKDDKLLRQAVQLASDLDAMNTQLVGGIGKPMNTFLPSTLSPYYDTSAPKFVRNVTKANSLLDQDGWTKNADGTRSKNGKKLAWVISTTSGNPQRAAEEELLISNWKDIGATVTTKNWPAGQFFDGFTNGGINATGQYDMSLYANSFAPDPDSWASLAISSQIPTAANPSGSNWDRMRDPKLDDLLTKGENTIDINSRISLYKQAQTEWADYMGYFGLYERPDVFGVGNNFGNFYPTANTCVSTCNAADWYKKGAS